MWETKFADRLYQLRSQKGVSARDMSLSLGQSPGYINRIENRQAFPSMSNFFYICDYLDVSPDEFFRSELEAPPLLRKFAVECQHLKRQELEHLLAIVQDLNTYK